MSNTPSPVAPTVTVSEAKALLKALAHQQSLLLLSPPGVGKSALVREAALEAGLPYRSLLGTQIAPEDVSGIPRILGERSVFCPPRVLLPESPEPFCLFLDELPACTPDVQKALYSLLLERRLGEHPLPAGTWVVAAGNRVEDRAFVRSISSALINRVTVLNVRPDVPSWLAWAMAHGVRAEVLAFVSAMPDALARPVPQAPVPFSTPRAWTSLSETFDLAERAGLLSPELRRVLAFGRLSPEDAAIFCAMVEQRLEPPPPALALLTGAAAVPAEPMARWLALNQVRKLVASGGADGEASAEQVNTFLTAQAPELLSVLLVDLVPAWARLGALPTMTAHLDAMTAPPPAHSAHFPATTY